MKETDNNDSPQELISYFETHHFAREKAEDLKGSGVAHTFPVELWNIS